MSAEMYVEDMVTRPRLEAVPDAVGADTAGPSLSGDLPTVLGAAPMFRRAVAGYDRFQVDTYVRWAEDELAGTEREREHLAARYLRTLGALEDARELLAHSPDGGEMLRQSRRIGALLAAAADEADSMRADAEAELCAAHDRANRMAADAGRVLADAEAEAARVVAEATAEAEAVRSEAGRILAAAQRTAEDADAQGQARLAEVRAAEQRAAEHAERIRQDALADAAAARLRARDEIVQMLGTGREQRRRADAEAAAVREQLDRAAAERRALLVAEVADLEARSSAGRAALTCSAG